MTFSRRTLASGYAKQRDQEKVDETGTVLLVALNTLAIVDQITPLPLLLDGKR
jgi:hypothetical protein